jgi:hypothetical protein
MVPHMSSFTMCSLDLTAHVDKKKLITIFH